MCQSKEIISLNSMDNALLEHIHPEPKDLSYTCLLIPGLPSFQLVGDLTNHLPQWLQQICVPNNWSLEFITVHADYFQWGLHVIPSTQPAQFMQMIRRQTSELIASAFQYSRKESLAGDFWAPGYLVILGIRPRPKEIIEQYIRLSRRQQESLRPDLRDHSAERSYMSVDT